MLFTLEIAEKLAERVYQLVTDTAHKRQLSRQALLNAYVEPVFADFEKLHAAYLESFIRYRDLIQSTKDPNWIRSLQATLEKENLFSANTRAKVLHVAEAEHGDLAGRFIASISEYLLGARLVDPLGKELSMHQAQRWRSSFFRRLTWIADKNWQMVIDPDGAAPPMQPEEIELELQQRRAKYPVDAATEDDAVRRACALSALDGVVAQMQYQYGEVCKAYAELRTKLR
jgi:hypothetical protein